MKIAAACLNPVRDQNMRIGVACLSRVRSQRVRAAVVGLSLVPLRVSVASRGSVFESRLATSSNTEP
jgi:hypothetical protein